jgi:hypothetical protein
MGNLFSINSILNLSNKNICKQSNRSRKLIEHLQLYFPYVLIIIIIEYNEWYDDEQLLINYVRHHTNKKKLYKNIITKNLKNKLLIDSVYSVYDNILYYVSPYANISTAQLKINLWNYVTDTTKSYKINCFHSDNTIYGLDRIYNIFKDNDYIFIVFEKHIFEFNIVNNQTNLIYFKRNDQNEELWCSFIINIKNNIVYTTDNNIKLVFYNNKITDKYEIFCIDLLKYKINNYATKLLIYDNELAFEVHTLTYIFSINIRNINNTSREVSETNNKKISVNINNSKKFIASYSCGDLLNFTSDEICFIIKMISVEYKNLMSIRCVYKYTVTIYVYNRTTNKIERKINILDKTIVRLNYSSEIFSLYKNIICNYKILLNNDIIYVLYNSSHYNYDCNCLIYKRKKLII